MYKKVKCSKNFDIILTSLKFNDMTKLISTILKLQLMVIFLLSFALKANSQAITVTGQVMDGSTKLPLVGASVVIKGTSEGTITDLDGNYQLTVDSPEEVLVYSFVGMVSQEVRVGEKRKIDIILMEDVTQLEDVVVIGYGTQRKDDLTGSVAVVDVEEMNKANFTTVDKALQGRTAGVYIASTGGKPGQSSTIKVRGIGSINMNAEPLVVIDGMPTTQEGIINALNPSDIESLQVLKDASAQAIYGARGANGVILITTKKGVSDRPKVNFNMNIGMSEVPKKYDVMNADQYSDFMKAAWDNYLTDNPGKYNMYREVYSDSARASNNNLGTTDWQDEIYRVAKKQNYNLSVSGGNENSNYYISGNYASEEGLLVNTALDRLTLRANSNFNISDRIKISESISLTHIDAKDESHLTTTGGALTSSPLMPVYDETAAGGYGGPTDTLTGANERTNPLAEQMLNDNTYKEYWFTGSVDAEVEILKGLKYKLKLGANYNINNRTQWSPVYRLGNLSLRDNNISILSESNNVHRELLINNLLNYRRSFGNHNVEAMVAYERLWDISKNMYVKVKDLPSNELRVLVQGQEVENVDGKIYEHFMESWLGRFNYDYLGKYLLTASFRVDGSSRFGPEGGRYGTFPSFSAGWKMNEDLLTDVEEIDLLKFRFGWGQTGNENIDDYRFLSLIDPLIYSRYTFGENQDLYLGGASTTFQPNPLIKWEAAEMINFGLDLDAFNSKIQVNAEYYIKNQHDMLVNVPISHTFGKRVNYGTGWPTVGAWSNLAKVQNRGIEFNIAYREFEKTFTYSISANFSTIKNEVIDVGPNDIINSYTITTDGEPIGSLYGYVAEGILQEEDFNEFDETIHAQQSNASPGDIKFKDVNGDSLITSDDRTIIGKPIPDFVYGLNFNGQYKGFDFTIFLQGMQGFDVINNQMRYVNIATDPHGKDENKLVDVMDYWTPENRSNSMTRPYVIDQNDNSRISSWFVEDASFLRIKNLQIGYTLPNRILQKINISRLRIYANANNLLTFTGYSGYDPEVSDKSPLNAGVDNNFYPIPRSYSLGLQLDF